MAQDNNYTLGRGRLYLARFIPETKTIDANGIRFMGNAPEFTVSVESENLDHFASTGGIREKDASVALETNRTSSIVVDDLKPDNLSLFLFGAAITVAQSAVSGLSETIAAVRRGNSYFLGVTDTTPTGVRGIDMDPAKKPTVTTTGGTGTGTPTAGIDYILDPDTGRFEVLDSSPAISDGASATINYALKAAKRNRIVSGSKPVDGALRFVADNPIGLNFDYTMPYVRVSPNGDLGIITEEWATIPLTLEILKLPGREAIYLDGRPYV